MVQLDKRYTFTAECPFVDRTDRFQLCNLLKSWLIASCFDKRLNRRFIVIPMSFTRREFAKLGALGLAARFAPPLFAQTAGPQTGYAIIGLGRIADIFMRGVKDSPNSKVTALVSGHRDKALRIAADYGVPESSIYGYDNFD